MVLNVLVNPSSLQVIDIMFNIVCKSEYRMERTITVEPYMAVNSVSAIRPAVSLSR